MANASLRSSVARGIAAVWLVSALVACNSDTSDGGPTDASTQVGDAPSGDAVSVTDAVSPTEATVDARSSDASAQPADGGSTDATQSTDATLDASTDAAPDVGSDAEAGATNCAYAVLGPAGGTVVHALGAQIVVPAGALADATQLSFCAEAAPVTGALGPAFQAGPEGQTFLAPVGVVLPFDPTLVTAGSDVSTIQMQMAPGGTTAFGSLQSNVDLLTRLVRATTTHFTQFVPAQSAAPVFITSSPFLPQATAGVAYSFSFTASGGTPPYAFTVPPSTSLPPGLSLSAAGLLSGTPTIANNFAFFVEVSDSANAAVELAISLEVMPPSNPVPTLTQVTPSSVAQGSGDAVIALSGTGFVPATQALWDGTPLPTTFIGSTQVAATVPRIISDGVSSGFSLGGARSLVPPSRPLIRVASPS